MDFKNEEVHYHKLHQTLLYFQMTFLETKQQLNTHLILEAIRLLF